MHAATVRRRRPRCGSATESCGAVQRALVHEHSIKALSGPSSTRPQRTIRLHSQRSVAVGGMQVAHWEAVKFLTRFADACGSLAQRGKHTNTEEEAARLRTRCCSPLTVCP